MNEDQINQAGLIGVVVGGIIGLVFAVLGIICMWKVFTKAGQPGWAFLIPIYDIIVMLQIVGKPLWWIVLFLIPGVNFVMAIILVFLLAKSFGKGPGFALGLIFLGIIFLPILAFGDARYQGPALPAA